MKYILYSLTAILSFSAFSCGTLIGKGEIITEPRHIPNFNAIILESSADIYITQGPLYLEVIGYENLVPDLTTEVKNNQLFISSKSNSIIENNNLEVHLAVPELVLIEIRGAGNVETVNSLNADQLTINLKGASNIHLAGTANQINCNLQGTGDIKVCEMNASNVQSLLNGTGNIYAYPNQTMTATINGTGNVYYLGNPQLNQQVNGVGSIQQIVTCQ